MCVFVLRDITNMKGTIVAQVDSSESFQEFCSTGCLGAYENKQNPPKSSLKTKCTVCGKLTEVSPNWRRTTLICSLPSLLPWQAFNLESLCHSSTLCQQIRHEVSFKTVTHKICSDTCFNVYRRANGLIMNCCEQCGDYLPSRPSANHFLLVDGQQKRFCCQNCIRDFKQVFKALLDHTLDFFWNISLVWWFLKAAWCLLCSDCCMSELFFQLATQSSWIELINGLNCEVSIKWFKLLTALMHLNNWVVFIFFFFFVVTGAQQTCNMPDLQNADQDGRGAARSGRRWRDGLLLLRQLLEQGQTDYSLLRRWVTRLHNRPCYVLLLQLLFFCVVVNLFQA